MSYSYVDVLGMIGKCRAVVITLSDNTQMLCELLSLNTLTGIKVKCDDKEDIITLDKITDIMQLSF